MSTNIERARIIINADDFGLSSAVNEAVLDGAENGVLTSATIMANMPGFDEAVAGAKNIERLGVGVHLNLLRGKPLYDPRLIPTLVDDKGKLIGNVPKLWMGFILGTIKSGDIERELSAQIERVIDSGITPTHFDSEKHLHHLFPRFGLIACRLAKKYGVKRIRVVREPLFPLAQPVRATASQFMKAAIINQHGMWLANTARKHGLTFVDRFYGLALTGRVTANAYRWLTANTSGGSVEVMCHPASRAGASADAGERSWLDHQRVNEYRALLDPETIEALSKVELINYGQLQEKTDEL
jgi:predicted glycoside hydrolase/deacetylase ChbG (UPF0249 family)